MRRPPVHRELVESLDTLRSSRAPAAVAATADRRGSRIGERLIAAGLLTAEQLEMALGAQQGERDRLGAVLVRLGMLQEDALLGFLSGQYNVPAVDVSQLEVDAEVLRLVPGPLAEKLDVLPIQRSGQILTLAMADPTNVLALDDVAFMTNLQIDPVLASEGALRLAIARLYYPAGDAADDLEGDVDESASASLRDLESDQPRPEVSALDASADEAPVVRLTNLILHDAVRQGASDVHLEPYEKVFRVRFRIDGVLREVMGPPKRLEAALISRVKIMANLDIAERRLPQDGRVKLRFQQRDVDFRVSTLPTMFGEKIVLRLLDRDGLQLDLGKLGFDAASLDRFGRAIRAPHGIILITGPTGSGKTTTLYSAIHALNVPDINIMTAEDPVEYNLKGVNQLQVNDEIGRTFAAALRSFLRQDPDVILVGETRDLETAQIAIRAALTGHLVLSTLHTNDCPSSVARLLDMGVPSFLVASSLLLVVAQRLARRVCRECREPREMEEDELAPYGHEPRGLGRVILFRGRGCPACSFTGLKGRLAIYETMPVSAEIRDLILHDADVGQIRAIARSQGMKTLRQNGLEKVIEGATTVDEVLRVTVA